MFVQVATANRAVPWYIRHSHIIVACIAGFLLGALTVSGGARGAVLHQWRRSDRGSGERPAGSAVPAPSLAAFRRIQADPGLLGGREGPALLAQFEAAPWLLPPRSAALPYAGVHGLEELLALRAAPVGNHTSGVALLLFNRRFAVMAQNSIFSLVRHAGVRNYLALTWTAADLAACADLNLPCANATGLLVAPLSGREKPTPHDFVALMWLKAAAVLRALQLGHVVMVADTDIAYSVKPLWDSYLAFIEAAGADGAWQQEQPLNTGHFVLLPTPASLAFAYKWNFSAPGMARRTFSEQYGVRNLLARGRLAHCASLCSCFNETYRLRKEGRRDEVPVFRGYLPAHYAYTLAWCSVGSVHWVPRIDPCDWSVLYVHPTCTKSSSDKEAILRAAGFWFLDSSEGEGCTPQPGAASGVPACRPLQWRQPQAEAPHFSCPAFGLGLVHGGEPAAAAALRAGLADGEARQLIDVGHRC